MEKKGQTFKQRRFNEDGTATFELVPLGETWGVSAWSWGLRMRKQILGPTRPGEMVPVHLRIPDNVAILVGRALDANHKPLVKRRIWIKYSSDGGGDGSIDYGSC